MRIFAASAYAQRLFILMTWIFSHRWYKYSSFFENTPFWNFQRQIKRSKHKIWIKSLGLSTYLAFQTIMSLKEVQENKYGSQRLASFAWITRRLLKEKSLKTWKFVMRKKKCENIPVATKTWTLAEWACVEIRGRDKS